MMEVRNFNVGCELFLDEFLVVLVVFVSVE